MQVNVPQAASNFKKKERKFPVQDVLKKEEFGYLMEREFIFLPEKDLVDKYKLEPKQLPCKWIEVQEGCDVLRGVLLLNPAQPHRILRLQSSLSSMMSEVVHDGSKQLRAKQASEVVECQREGIQKQLRLGETVFTMASLDLKVQEAKNQIQNAEAEKELAKALTPLEELPSQDEAKHAGILGGPLLDEEEEEKEEDERQKRAVFMEPSISSALLEKKRIAGGRGGKANPKSKSQTKAKAKCSASNKRPRSTGVGSEGGSVADEDDNTTKRARSSVDETSLYDELSQFGAGGKIPKDDQLFAGAQEKMQKVNAHAVIAAHSLGNEMYHLRRIRDALSKSAPYSHELLKVKDCLEKANSFASLQACNIMKLSPAKREELIKLVLEESPDMSWPKDVQLALVTVADKVMCRWREGG